MFFRFAIERPIIVAVGILILSLFGVLAIFRVPIQMIPDLDPRVVSIRTLWPGATPQDVEKEILVEQEDYLRNIAGLERMLSNARTGRAEIELEFPHGVDINEALIRVNNALSQVPAYPENVDEPRIATSSFSDNPFMFFRVTPLPGNPQNVDMTMMKDYVEDYVKTRIERVSGVSEAYLWSGAERQIQIYVDPTRLAERGITIAGLRQAIRGRNRDVSGGDIESGKRRYLLRTVGRFRTIEEIEDLIIAERDGVLVHLRDVGHVELGHFEESSVSIANGARNITLGVRRQVGTNVVEVMDGVMAIIDDINRDVLAPKGLMMALNSEDVQYVKDAIAVVRQNLIIGAVLATLVLWLFLRSTSATLIGAMGIPICTVAAFLGLLVSGRTINVISLAGVAFAIGMTLDNSIVVLESIYRHMAMGKARLQAALDGVREVWTAVLAATLTTVFVFIPIVFVKEEAGQLYSDIAVAIAASIMMSMLVAVTVIPATCARFVSVPDAAGARRYGLRATGAAINARVLGFVGWLTAGTLRRVVLIALVLAATFGIITGLTPKAEYLPEGEEQKVFSRLFAPPGYNLQEMAGILYDMNDYFSPYVGRDPARYDSGEDEVPALNFVMGYANSSMVMLLPEVTAREHIDDLIDIVARRFGEVPGMISFASRGSIFASNNGGTRSINLDIAGEELGPLFETGFRAFSLAKTVFENPQVLPEPSTLSLGQPLLEVRPDWARAAELGFNADELGYTVWAFSDGAFVDEFFLGDDKIDMFLYSTLGTIDHPQDLENLVIYAPNGSIVPLSAVATVTPTLNTELIRRVDGARTITLSIIPPRSVPLEQGVETVRAGIMDAMREAGELPPGVTMSISGASDRLTATREALAGNFLVAILIAYLLMVAIFSHWGYPLVIMTTVPIGISGGIVGLWLLNWIGARLPAVGLDAVQQPFDVITMLGFLVLIGTVVNNPILIVEQALTNVRERGMQCRDAVVAAVGTRLRPIVMSTITTVFGLSPLVFLPGAGTELYRGLGTIVLFGLLFSAIVTLTFMPSLLSLILEWREAAAARAATARTAGSH